MATLKRGGVNVTSQDKIDIKTDLGLQHVDNTSDANKPISSATQTALDAKAATLHTQAASTISDSTTAGRALLTAADASAQRTALGLGTAATTAATDYATAAQGTLAASAVQDIGTSTAALTAKTTPVDADTVPVSDSAASAVGKKITWANIKATLKTYFDTLYQAVLVSGTSIKTINGTSVLGSGDLTISGSGTTVENVLTSTSTTNALSAAQGKALKDTADTLATTVSGKLTASNNLSDLGSASTARTNLGLNALATVTPGTGVATFLGTPSSANLLAAVTDETGTGALVFANSPTLVTPALGTPASGVLTNATGLPPGGLTMATARLLGRSTAGTGVAEEITLGTNLSFSGTTLNATGGSGGGDVTAVGPPSSGQVAEWTSATSIQGVAVTGTGNYVRATSPTLTTPALGTPSALTLTNATGLPVAGGGTGVATLTAYAPIFGGTTSTGAVQSGGVGTAGQVLTSNGAGALPTFQAAASGGGYAETAIASASIAGTTGTAGVVYRISDGVNQGVQIWWATPAGAGSPTWTYFISSADAFVA